MGVYYSQALTIFGPQDDFLQLLDLGFTKDEAGTPCGINFEAVAPAPQGLPDGLSIGPLGFDVDVGVEVITRAPMPRLVDGVDYGWPSVLAHAKAKKLGLTNYDKLLQWLQKNRPETLAIGRAAIDAHVTTGYWSQLEWQQEYWGEADLNDFEIESLTDTKIVARFYTKGLPCGQILRAMGQRFPSLNFRLAALDDGAECPYLATSMNGQFVEEYVEATDAFITETEGQPRDESAFYTEPSVLQLWPMTHIRFWSAERKVKRGLANYPVYEPPFKGLPSSLSMEQAEANFNHFMATRATRLTHLGDFLKPFDVALDTSVIGLEKLDRWIEKYGAFLTVHETGASFWTLIPAWREERLGLNVIFDLATFLGETIIERHVGFRWNLYLDEPTGLRKGSELYQAIFISIQTPQIHSSIWLFRRAKEACEALREKSFMWKKPFMRIEPLEAATQFMSYNLAKIAERMASSTL